MNVLDTIVVAKRKEVARAKARVPPELLREQVRAHDDPFRFSRALTGPGPNIIAEVKRASPSAGLIRGDGRAEGWNPTELAEAYRDGGAAALSVLTDIQFFWGHPDCLLDCAEATGLPAIRKDFVLETYQVDESRWLGADAVLLIARILDLRMLVSCAERAQELGMDVLVELHHERELEAALAAPGAIVGVNHRDLDTLDVDLDLSLRLRDRIPSDRLVVAESGVSQRPTVERLLAAGFANFLVGEHLARHADPAGALRELRG